MQAWLTARFREAALAANRADLLSWWSGQSAPLLRHRRAGELLKALVSDAEQVLRH